MVVFSTKAGESAADSTTADSTDVEKKDRSPFAKALIEDIQRYHWQPLEDTLQKVGQAVNETMKGKQQVYVYGWVGKPFCLSRCLNTRSITITP